MQLHGGLAGGQVSVLTWRKTPVAFCTQHYRLKVACRNIAHGIRTRYPGLIHSVPPPPHEGSRWQASGSVLNRNTNKKQTPWP
jgi:hypothetical protein